MALYANDNPKTAAFLAAIGEVCKEHGFSLSHEDGHGAFIVVPYDQHYVDWLNAAFIEEES